MCTKNHPYFVTAVIGFLLCFGNAARGQTTAPNPQAILIEMVHQYGRASTYQDSGVVRILPSDPANIAGVESPLFRGVSFQDDTLVSFKTYFARPGMFRFEWRGPLLRGSREAAIWSDGKKAYSWTPLGFPRKGGFALYGGGDLGFYIDEGKGSSGGSIFFVPSLLLEDVVPSSFADLLSIMEGLSLLREERIDGEPCHVIKGNISGVPWVLWVGKNSRLLRKTRTSFSSGTFHERLEKKKVETFMAEELHRDIKINEKIPEEVFKYRPRLQAHDVDLTR